jgi:hypothetical protein
VPNLESASLIAGTDTRLERYARVLVWAAPIWAVVVFIGTLDDQPPPQTAFAEYARSITTARFLASHLVASILGPRSARWGSRRCS